ncbi:hypothetical protein L3X38_026088 [Prunus dulcis]|uniref:DUF4218 domain-containing protein n=1 Tax=Prunus dulcis TaxID=3755 RepID=A0AAD4W302_PRUDU|nr:hypothetical protein L3X38_026088 [Prunus dulcis]
MEVVREETKKIEARAKESVTEAVRAEREILLKQFSQLIPNFEPNLLCKTPTTPITPIPQERSPKNPMSDKASCSNVRALEMDEDNPTNDADADAAENHQDEKLDMPAPLLALCQYVKTKLKPANETIRIHMPEKMFGTDHDTWLLSEDILQFASMVEIGSIKPARHMKMLKGYVQNRTRPKGCITEWYIAEEAVKFCTEHLFDVSTVGVPSSQKMGVSKPLSGCTNTEEVLP